MGQPLHVIVSERKYHYASHRSVRNGSNPYFKDDIYRSSLCFSKTATAPSEFGQNHNFCRCLRTDFKNRESWRISFFAYPVRVNERNVSDVLIFNFQGSD